MVLTLKCSEINKLISLLQGTRYAPFGCHESHIYLRYEKRSCNTYLVPKLLVFLCPGTNLDVAFGVAGVDLPGDEVAFSERWKITFCLVNRVYSNTHSLVRF